MVELSTVMERSWSGKAFPRRETSYVLSRLSLRWWADIQIEISVWHPETYVTSWVSEGRKEKVS